MARLVLVNGPPAVGKTTLAARYVADHPLALNLDIDALRCAMGQWETHDHSKQLARALAVAMARVHLKGGNDVVIPQLLARTEFIEVLEGVAAEAGAVFHETLLMATTDETLQRFRDRRAALEARGVAHPQRSVEPDAESIAAIIVELEDVARRRPQTRVIRAGDGVDTAYAALGDALG